MELLGVTGEADLDPALGTCVVMRWSAHAGRLRTPKERRDGRRHVPSSELGAHGSRGSRLEALKSGRRDLRDYRRVPPRRQARHGQ